MTEQNAPAYPPYHNPNTHDYGLTKRELFAAMAMQGLMANSDYSGNSVIDISKVSVGMADDLIMELNK
jgi:hypothetical protein